MSSRPDRAALELLQTCAKEPIHIPGSIQPHGLLLAIGEDGSIEYASANAAGLLGCDTLLPGLRLDEIEDRCGRRLGFLNSGEAGPHLTGMASVEVLGVAYQEIAHRCGPRIIVELEPDQPELSSPARGNSEAFLYPLVTRFIGLLNPKSTQAELAQVAADEIRNITAFDRVLVYRFEESWDGRVLAESRNRELPSYLDLRFPGSDIPEQARQLYTVNRVRIIPDANYIPVPIQAAPGMESDPLDLTHSVLRSVSPVHLEYMRNMGTMASMSISILHEGRLWGLISCHNKMPRNVPFRSRSVCDIIARILSSQLVAVEHREDAELRVRLKGMQGRVLAHIAKADSILEGLRGHGEELMACTDAAGAAVLSDGDCLLFGLTPGESQVKEMAQWAGKIASGEVAFSTSCLSEQHAAAAEFADRAAGLIAVPISSVHDSFVMWFRPELPQTIAWGGDPRKPAEENPTGGMPRPRRSFEVWKETVRLRAQPWLPGEVDSARELREGIVGVVLRKAEELARVTQDLRISNQELEAFSYSVSHDLRAPFRHISGYAELLKGKEEANLSESGKRYVQTIIDSAQFAGALVDNLLHFAQIGRATLDSAEIDVHKLVAEARADTMREAAGRAVEWRIGELPVIHGDLFMLRLVFQNLFSNALKYTRPRQPAVIEVSAERQKGDIVFTVRDNGVGFDPRYTQKLFGIFQRLHRMEDFEGTGIGLANVRRIVSRHGGRTWAEGEVDRGAAIYFSLPADAK